MKFTKETKVIFNQVGPDGAVLSEGMIAHVMLDLDSTDTAAQVMLTPAPPPAERQER